MREIEEALGGIKGRWMTGMEAAPAAPPAWKPLLDGKDDAELRLLALAGQVTRVAMRPLPSEKLAPAPLLPALALPGMPEDARIRFRQIMTNAKNDGEAVRRALLLAAARGYAAHPADWMPGKTEADAPALYAPWVDWLNAGAARERADVLDAQTWDAWYPAERRAALAEMRRSDPAAARDLLAAKVGDVAAEERMRLVGLLAEGLDEADAGFLESLAKDRSGKVKALAASLLARIGHGEGDVEATAELAETLEIKGGMLRSRTLGPKKLKNNAQRMRRNALFAQVSLAHLAGAVGLSPEEAVALWDIGRDIHATPGFVEMVAASGADGLPGALALRLFGGGQGALISEDLIARLSAGERAGIAPLAIARDDFRFSQSLDMAGDALGCHPMSVLEKSDALRTLITALKTAIGKADEDWRANASLADGMRALGLLADREAAVALLRRFTGLGLIAADPRLDMLHLNVALEDRR